MANLTCTCGLIGSLFFFFLPITISQIVKQKQSTCITSSITFLLLLGQRCKHTCSLIMCLYTYAPLPPTCHSDRHWPIETCLASFSIVPAHKMQLSSEQSLLIFVNTFLITHFLLLAIMDFLIAVPIVLLSNLFCLIA